MLLVFLDGVGIGADDPASNPLAAARLPRLRALLGGQLPLAPAFGAAGRIAAGRACAVAVDATLGVPGRPQSGTGQTSLLTGRNAAALFGRHFGVWVPTPLRPMLAEESLFARVAGAGRRAVFANARPAVPPATLRRPPAFPFAALTAGLAGHGASALASSLGSDAGRAREAGAVLARIAAAADFTAFAHYDTDAAGHRRNLAAGVGAMERVDAFLGGVLNALPEDVLLLVTSDHGNLEDVRGGHTRNPVPLIAAGPGAERLTESVRTLLDVAPAVCSHLGLPHLPSPPL